MADAVLWQILEAVQTRLQGMTFAAQGTDTLPTIHDDAIVIRKYTRGRDNEGSFQNDRKPGIVLCLPGRAVRDPQAGTNLRDDVQYAILAQIISADHDDRLRNLRTYLKWQEQIAKAFHNQRVSDDDFDGGCVSIGMAVSVDNVDETQWVQHANFVAGVELHFISREPRGIV